MAQNATVAVGTPITISPSSDNVLNLLAPYLSLNATTVGQTTLSTNLSQAVATNNGASLSLQQLGESDENLLGSGNGTALRTQAQGYSATALFGVAANLGGGLPTQAVPAGGAVAPMQAVGGLGVVLGAAYFRGINASTTTNGGPLSSVAVLLNNAYTNFTSVNLGVAKNYFADGGANSTVTYAADNKTVTSATTFPAVAPSGYTLPTSNGLPNTTTSVYDNAYGVTNKQSGQDVFGSSRPDQASTGINSFDPTALSQLAGNPSFPSGHATYAYTDSILLAMLVPQEYQSMLYRGSAYANSRIVVGVHYPLDIIASRALASYDLSQAFTNPLYQNNATTTGTAINLPANFSTASAQITPYLTSASATAGCGTTITACAASAANTTNDPYAVTAANAATYTSNLTYGLPTLTFAQAPQEAAPAGGPDASILLEPIYGGNTTAATTIATAKTMGGTQAVGTNGALATSTINQIIVNTETNALAAFYGTSLSYWTRIDLAAASGYFGNLTGTLSLASTDVVSTPISVASGGQLNANGATIGSTTINAGGTLAASSAMPIGTIANINGNLTFAPGSSYNVRITPTSGVNDTTNVTGAAALNGTLNVTPSFGVYKGSSTYTILTTFGGPASISGSFSSVNTNSVFLAGSVSLVGDPMAVLTVTALPFSTVAQTRNQANVGFGLTNGASNPLSAAGASIIANLQTIATAGQAQGVLNGLSGEGITAAQNAAHRSVSEFTSSIFDQTTFYGGLNAGNSITLTNAASGLAPLRELADLPTHAVQPVAPYAPPRTWRAWATGFGGEENIHGTAGLGSASQADSIYGGSLGIDYQITPNYLIGVAVGGTDGEFSVNGRATSGSTTGGHIAFYDLATFGPIYAASSNSFSYFTNHTTRLVSGFGAVGGENDRGVFNSDEFRTRLEVGRHFDGSAIGFGNGVLTPFVALEIAELRSNGFTETNLGGPTVLGLNVQGQSSASVPAFVGARYQGSMSLPNGMLFSPSLQAAYVHEFAPERQQFANFVSLPGSTFLVDGARPSRNAAQVKAGAELLVGPRASLFVTFDGEFSGLAQFYGGKGGFKYLF